AALAVAPDQLLAWIGPAIDAAAFEVGPEVRAAFLAADAEAVTAFQAGRVGRWQADLVTLARQRLRRAGVAQVWGGHWCTSGEPAWFFSHRRDGTSGRMAALIWRA
ncbi:MAG: laccase domain-containing protein, partial [Candidatus Macondimonas sp.]